MTNFKVGDKVSDHGRVGVIDAVDDCGDMHLLRVAFGQNAFACYTLDGRVHVDQTEPSLKLLERPKSKKTVTMYPAICKRASSRGTYIYVTDAIYANQEDAKKDFGILFIALGPAITFEIESKE